VVTLVHITPIHSRIFSGRVQRVLRYWEAISSTGKAKHLRGAKFHFPLCTRWSLDWTPCDRKQTYTPHKLNSSTSSHFWNHMSLINNNSHQRKQVRMKGHVFETPVHIMTLYTLYLNGMIVGTICLDGACRTLRWTHHIWDITAPLTVLYIHQCI
jgi:hypothetical protein